MKDFSFRVKTKPKQKTQLASPMPKTAQVWHSRLGQGRAPCCWDTSHPHRREIRATRKCPVNCRLRDNPLSALTAPRTESRAQADRPSTPPAEGEQEGREPAKGRGWEASTRALGRGPGAHGRFRLYASEHGEPKRGTGTSGEFVTSGVRCLKASGCH